MKMEKLLPDRWIEPKMHEKDDHHHHQCENAISLLFDDKIKRFFSDRTHVYILSNGQGDNSIHLTIAIKTYICNLIENQSTKRDIKAQLCALHIGKKV